MAEPVFVDTFAWIAALYTGDNWHSRTVACFERLGVERRPLLTTSAIVLETLDGFAQQRLRHLAPVLRHILDNSPHLECVGVDTMLLRRGWLLYEERPDKKWSLTDCISFLVMRDRNLVEALTHDHHFEQAGFRALLREGRGEE